MSTKEDYLNSLNKINRLLKEKKYEEAIKYIETKKPELIIIEENKTENYIEELLNDLK